MIKLEEGRMNFRISFLKDIETIAFLQTGI